MSEVMTVQCECAPVHETRYRFDGDRTPSEAVIEALATAEEVEPTELPPLYRSVEPDALNRLFGDPEEGPAALLFDHAGWNVFVRGDGTVIICDPEQRGETTALFHDHETA